MSPKSKDTSTDDRPRNNALSKSVAGAARLISANAFSRILTFVLNQVLVMYFTTPAVLGVVHVQLELLLSTVLFLGREPARMTVLRGKQVAGGSNDRTNEAQNARSVLKEIVDLAYVSVVLGVALTVGVTLFLAPSTSSTGPGSGSTAYFLYALASILELLAEPMYLVGQHRLMLSQRAQIEAFATTMKTAMIVASMAFFYLTSPKSSGGSASSLVSESHSVVAFALGQVAFGLSIFVGWAYQWAKEFRLIRSNLGTQKKREGLPSAKDGTKITAEDEDSALITEGFAVFLPLRTDKSDISLNSGFRLDPFFATYCWQSMLKFLLNEGDRILLNALASPEQQGVWAFVFNYGMSDTFAPCFTTSYNDFLSPETRLARCSYCLLAHRRLLASLFFQIDCGRPDGLGERAFHRVTPVPHIPGATNVVLGTCLC
jgi:oligosaccharide translocation protein RFT1